MLLKQHVSENAAQNTAYFFQSVDALKAISASAAEQAALLALKPGQTAALHFAENGRIARRFFVCLPETLSYDKVEEAADSLLKAAKEQKAETLSAVLPASLSDYTEGLYKRLLLANDSFDRYKTTGIAPHDGHAAASEKTVLDITIEITGGLSETAENEKLRRADIAAQGIMLARRLVNEPANVMTPARLAEEAQKQGAQCGFTVDVYDEQQIQDMGLHAFYSVAKGSDTPPRLIVMQYLNAPEADHRLALVGKGLTYDSGGYALKPAQGMDTMYCDMGGSAAVIGAMSILARLKARVNVVAVVAACENMISGHAYRNGDIIPSLSGKFIEIQNTDAEGRLTLADAITYAATALKADRIIDIATLTGACGIALGDHVTALIADDEGIVSAMGAASRRSGDKVWRLPHDEHFAKCNESERADIKNIGGRAGGTITAGLFCRAFACGKGWAHLDIAATAFHDKPCAKSPAGATGVGAELLAYAAEKLFA